MLEGTRSGGRAGEGPLGPRPGAFTQLPPALRDIERVGGNVSRYPAYRARCVGLRETCGQVTVLIESDFFLFRIGSGKAVSNVIVESQNSDNEEDEQFMVEAAPQLPEMSELDMVSQPGGVFL